MRYITLRLAVALSTFLVGVCATMLWFLYAGASKPSSMPLVILQERPGGRVIMEASMYYGGMYTYVGDLLRLRVYDSGHVEYEELDGNMPKGRSAELSADDLSTLVDLSRRPDLLKAKDKYPALVIEEDTYEVETIRLSPESGDKKIVLHSPGNSIVLPSMQSKSNYPPSLVSLLKKIDQIRACFGLKY